jgi:hypothetical protein
MHRVFGEIKNTHIPSHRLNNLEGSSLDSCLIVYFSWITLSTNRNRLGKLFNLQFSPLQCKDCIFKIFLLQYLWWQEWSPFGIVRNCVFQPYDQCVTNSVRVFRCIVLKILIMPCKVNNCYFCLPSIYSVFLVMESHLDFGEVPIKVRQWIKVLWLQLGQSDGFFLGTVPVDSVT